MEQSSPHSGQELIGTTERVAHLTRRFLAGERLQVGQVMRDYGMSRSGARDMLYRLSPVLGLTRYRRQWYVRRRGCPEPWD